jgi:hypothetical protein
MRQAMPAHRTMAPINNNKYDLKHFKEVARKENDFTDTHSINTSKRR